MDDLLLPPDWIKVKLEDSINSSGVVSDGDWVESKDQDPSGNIRLIQLADIGDGHFLNKSNRFMNERTVERLNCTLLQENDVLIARMPDPLGRACLFPKLSNKSVTVVDVCLVRFNANSAFLPKVFMYWINSPVTRGEIELQASGTTRKRITRKKLSEFDFPLPPFTEQKIIAEKLDAMVAKVESIETGLARIPQILKHFRQSVLAAAVCGKLTEEWRGENSFRFKTQELGGLAKFIDYRGKTPTKSESGIPLITAKNIRQGFISREPREYIAQSDYDSWMTRGIPKYGDVLITTEAPMGYIANIDLKEKFALAQRAICLQFCDDVNPYFASIYMQAADFQKELDMNSTGSTVKGIKAALLKKIKINYPPKEEQSEIVRRVEQLFAYSKKIEQQTQNALARVVHLNQSILAKAFRGELTEQWRKENPELISGEHSAQVLLQKIKAEREMRALEPKVKKKEIKRMSQKIIKIIDALEHVGIPLTGQELFRAAGYPNNSDTSLIEQFYLDLREAVEQNLIIKNGRDDDGQDWFALKEK